MHLKSLKANNFRNLEKISVEFSADLNIIYGDNAAGKSSFLEAITYLISARSFRSSKQSTFSNYAASSFDIFGEFSDSSRLGVMYTNKEKTKLVKLNGELVKSLVEVVNIYPVQSLSPESYHLVDSGPNERRKFLDWILFHVEHRYQKIWSDYNRMLKQRNALLRHKSAFDLQVFKTWNKQFIESAELLNSYRVKIAVELCETLALVLRELGVSFAEEIKLSYYAGYTGELADKLASSLERDRLNGTTQYGPHKADLKISVNGLFAKDVLSRGQKKVLINCLFLAQTRLLKSKTNKDSLFVIDDFSSELDEYNQMSLVKALCAQRNVQIIMSCLQPDMIKQLIKEYNSVKMFHVEHGVVKPQNVHIEN
jgi:DNA replication and repair protein RecF